MDKSIQIQLGSTKNVNSTNVDTFDKISFENQRKEILEYNIRNILSITDVFEQERQNTSIYRIYGGLEYLSILNGLKRDYQYISDFFIRKSYNQFFNTSQYKNIFTSFDFYLLRPSGYTYLEDTENEYVTQFEVIATPDDFDLFKAGYSRNIFDEPKYTFIFNKDFDITNWTDGFGFPITELYLYPKYIKATNSYGSESVSATTWLNDGTESIIPLYSENLNIGDVIRGNKIKYQKSNFLQILERPQTHYISTPYTSENVTSYYDEGDIIWKYEPFIPLKLRYFSNEVSRANTGGTSYDEVSDIPTYATHLGNGNMVWREILDQGYIDPLTGDGVDYPFVNKRRYLFSNAVLNVIPDLNDDKTSKIFEEINFNNPSTLNNNPLGNLDNIGKPCQ